jgi:hypothetical protein
VTPRLLSLALLLSGLWLGLLVASWVAATVNFRTVDQVLGPAGRREALARFEPVKAEDRRMLLRHLASEINRFLFRWWSRAQLLLGLGLVGILWALPGTPRWLALAALLVAVAQAAGLAGPITDLGRSVDFLPRPLPPDLGRRFGLLHAGYVLLDLGKAAVLVTLAALLVRRG